MFCEKCGKNIDERSFCPYCRHGKVENLFCVTYEKRWDVEKEDTIQRKSRFTAGVLQMFLGCIGAGRFYMKSYKIGFFQILVSIFSMGFGGFLWGVIDGFRLLSGRVINDGKGERMGV